MKPGEGFKLFCDGCKKEAAIHLTAIVNGKVAELYFCNDCPLLKQSHVINALDVKDVLAGLSSGSLDAAKKKTPDIECKNCHMTFKEFQAKGLLGCSECCKTFQLLLPVILKNIHGSSVHLGKTPQRSSESEEVQTSFSQLNRLEKLFNLKEKLAEAVKTENYEFAAQLRDKIDEMETKEVHAETEKFMGEGI